MKTRTAAIIVTALAPVLLMAQSVRLGDVSIRDVRVVTNEQDAAAIALLNASNAVAVSVSAGLMESNALRVAEIAGLVDSNAAARAAITGLYASNATVSASVGALELGTNRWNAAAALAATALQPSWAATGMVANAQRLVSADGSLMWTEIENGTNWQYCVTNSANVYVSGVSGAGYNGPPVGTVMFGGPDTWVDAGATYQVSWAEIVSAWQLTDLFEYYQWIDAPSEFSLPKSLGGSSGGVGTLTIDWVPVTNRTQIATQTGTVILLSEHNADASIHPTLPRHSDVTNTVSAAIAAYPPIPTNAVSGWLLFDPGSNMWLRVSVSNWSFTVWEVVQ